MNSTASPPSQQDLTSNPNNNAIENIIYQKDAIIEALEYSFPNNTSTLSNSDSNEISQQINSTTVSPNRTNYTTQGPRLEQKVTSEQNGEPRATMPISTERPCPLDCGPGGGCVFQEVELSPVCLCPLGRGGNVCEKGN